MNTCDKCNQPLLTSDPYRTAPFQDVKQNKPLPKLIPWLKRTITMASSTISSRMTLETLRVVGGWAPVAAAVIGIAYLPLYTRGCTVHEMREAKALSPIQVSPSELYREYHINATEANAKYNDKWLVLPDCYLEDRFTSNNQEELIAPVKAGVYAQSHHVWLFYDPKKVGELDYANAYGNAHHELLNHQHLDKETTATFICKGSGAGVVSNELTPFVADCRLANGAEEYYARKP